MPLTAEDLAGQVRDVMLDHVKNMNTVWAQMPEAEQKAYIETTSKSALQVVEQAIGCVMSEGGTTLDATCHDVRIKKESVQAAISIDRSDENAALLQAAAHKPVKLAFVSSHDKLVSLGETPKPDADQPEMFKSDDEVIGRPVSTKVEETPTKRRRTTRVKEENSAPTAKLRLA